MKNSYIPEILKEKIYLFLKYIYAFFLLLLSILSLLSFLTFDINDNSFLTSTSNEAQNVMGDLGSYYASFIFYTFGVLGYFVTLFFLGLGMGAPLMIVGSSFNFLIINPTLLSRAAIIPE